MSITYGITEEVYSLGTQSRRAYGIAAYDESETGGTEAVLLSVHDITADKALIERLVRECNQLQLSVVHLRDVIEDFMATL